MTQPRHRHQDLLRCAHALLESAASSETKRRPGFDRVRLPGERGLQHRAEQLDRGVTLHPGIMPGLAPWIDKLRVAAPPALS